MLKINVLNAFSEPFPNKCQLLNSILETSNTKDLCLAFELITNHVFANNQIATSYSLSDINNNQSQTGNLSFRGEYRPAWPLKLINRSQYGLDYDCIFAFLNTSSLFWSTVFKLDSLGPIFSISANSLPQTIAARIDSDLSLFSSRIDAFNNLNLSALEYFFFFFFMLMHDTRTNSRRVYNEAFHNIELDSLYADLLNDYLNFFLPVSEREVNFPSISSSAPSPGTSSPTPSSCKQIHRTAVTASSSYPSLFKRVIQKNATDSSADFSLMSCSQVAVASSSSTTADMMADRAGDMKKIDTFLRLINQLLVWPFTDPCSGEAAFPRAPPIQTLSPALKPVTATTNPRLSPSKYDDFKHNLSNVEIVFALSMIIKHSHFFSNAFLTGEIDRSAAAAATSFSEFSFRGSRASSAQIEASPLDELRRVLFKTYWRKSFYQFFRFHLEHLPFTPNLRWFLELWFTYIQPWSFAPAVTGEAMSRLCSEFINDNYLIYNDVYQLVLRRFCIGDLTSEANLQLLSRILLIFADQRELIRKSDFFYTSGQFKLTEHSRMDYQTLFRHFPDTILVFNVFSDLEKPVHMFKSVSGPDNLKIVANLFEALVNAKNLITTSIEAKNKPGRGLLSSLYHNLFSNDDESHLSNIPNVPKVLDLIDECLNLLELFFKSQSNFDDFDAIFTAKKCPQQLTEKRPSDANSAPDYELSSEGCLKLTPKGRYQMLNGLRKAKIVNVYDPETAPIGEFENRFLVYLLAFVANSINERFGNEFESVYTRNDMIGKLAKKCLYGPASESRIGTNRAAGAAAQKNVLKRRLIYDEAVNFEKPRLNLRKLASYKFIFYFAIFVLLLRLFSNWSYGAIVMLVSASFFFYSIFQN